MKNKVFSLLLLAAMFTLPLSVHAEEPKVPSDFNDQKSVVVGDVDTTVYSLDVYWKSLSYDWKYNNTTNKFEFKASAECEGYSYTSGNTHLESLKEAGVLYSDNQCSVQQTGDLVSGTTYYAKTNIAGGIIIQDNSINGRVKAAVEFTPSQNYNWVVGKFYSSYSLVPSTGELEYTGEVLDGYLPVVSGVSSRMLQGWLKLDVNSNYTGEKTVETGTTIGTVTLSISQDTD